MHLLSSFTSQVQFKLIEENKELKAAFQKMQSDLDGLLGEKMNLEEEMDRLKHQLQESEDTVNALVSEGAGGEWG